jgi:hypothetical protein
VAEPDRDHVIDARTLETLAAHRDRLELIV